MRIPIPFALSLLQLISSLQRTTEYLFTTEACCFAYGSAVFSVKASIHQILRHKKAIAAIWVLLILFPNPLILPLDVYRFFEMPTQPTNDVQLVAASLPANGTIIEQYVDAHVHYTYDFQAYGCVWYLPTPSDVLKSGQGDCKSRAILTASLLQAKGIPYTLEVSPIHFWVDYSGRPQTNFSDNYETTQVAVVNNGQFQLPTKTNALLYLNTYKDIVWTSMPLLRKIALVGGLAIIFQFGHFEGPKKRIQAFLTALFSKLRVRLPRDFKAKTETKAKAQSLVADLDGVCTGFVHQPNSIFDSLRLAL